MRPMMAENAWGAQPLGAGCGVEYRLQAVFSGGSRPSAQHAHAVDLTAPVCKEPAMHRDLKQFVRLFVGVVTATLFVVFSVAFVALPYTLGAAPGQIPHETAGAARHMT
jgi:hypothetical protein